MFKKIKWLLIFLVIVLIGFLFFYWFQIRPQKMRSYCEREAIKLLGVQGEFLMRGEYSDPILYDVVVKLTKNKEMYYQSCLRTYK